jgi:23S rRNA pseudouridine1911/1915/1917 synthase
MQVIMHDALNVWWRVQVLYEDQHMLAVNKPPGLRMAPRHRFEGGSLLNRMLHHLGTATGGAKPYIVHRLDMDTSGVVVFAKTASAADALCRQFRERSSRKEYVALCVAAPTAAASASASAFTAPVTTTFHVDAPIGRSPLGKEYRAVVPDGDASYTEFRTLAVGAWHGTPVYAMHAAPRTGRTHQVRSPLRPGRD